MKPKVMYHLVLLSFKRADKADESLAALARLREEIPGMRSYTDGPYSSPEGLNRGFTHAFVMTFESAAARDNYLSHPEHERVKNAVLPFVENVLAFDFEG